MNETDYVLAYADYLSHLNGKCTDPDFIYMTCIYSYVVYNTFFLMNI